MALTQSIIDVQLKIAIVTESASTCSLHETLLKTLTLLVNPVYTNEYIFVTNT